MKLPIKRWDAVLTACSDEPKPMIYINPTVDFLNIAKYNSDIMVRILNPGDKYHGFVYSGVIDKSSLAPSCRPRFYDLTKLYVITLVNADWLGYPKNMGEVEIITDITDFKPDIAEPYKTRSNNPKPDFDKDKHDDNNNTATKSDSKGSNLNTTMIISAIAVAIVILVALLIYNLTKKK